VTVPWRREAVLALVLALAGVALVLVWWVARPPAAVGRVAAPPAAPVAATATTPPPTVNPTPTSPFPLVTARPAAPVPPAPVLLPQSIDVPAQRISAPVLDVGVDEAGLLQIPEDGDDIGWYRWSAVPGEPGTSVFAGHVDTLRDGPGAFFRLEDTQVGDRVAVTLADGSVREFSVTGRASFPKQALPVDTVFRRGGPPQLVLVTCSGPFDRKTRSYEENLVVTADPVP